MYHCLRWDYYHELDGGALGGVEARLLLPVLHLLPQLDDVLADLIAGHVVLDGAHTRRILRSRDTQIIPES